MQHPKQELTFVMMKPDGVKRGLVGEFIKRLEQRGLKVIALSMVVADREKIDSHLPKSQEWITRLGEKTMATYQKFGYDAIAELGTDVPAEIGPKVREWAMQYLLSGPVVKMVVEGIHAITMVRKIAGDTMPANADMGTFRGDYSVDSAASANRDKRAIHNLVHASETPEESKHEIDYWFTPQEIHDYKRSEEDVMF